jgi:hypothetical protein
MDTPNIYIGKTFQGFREEQEKIEG